VCARLSDKQCMLSVRTEAGARDFLVPVYTAAADDRSYDRSDTASSEQNDSDNDDDDAVSDDSDDEEEDERHQDDETTSPARQVTVRSTATTEKTGRKRSLASCQ